MNTRLHRAAILIAYLALCLTHSAALPLFESTDEGAHFVQVNHIATHATLPDLTRERPSHESAQPPLYHILAALAIAPVDRANIAEVLRPNPDFDDPELNRNNSRTTVRNQYLHGPAEAFPYRGAALATHVARGVSMLLGALTLLCAEAIARLLFHEFVARGWTILRPEQAAAFCMALIAFNPRFVHVTSLINNDNGALFFSVAAVLWIMRTWSTGRPRDGLVLGVLVGAALLSKLSGLAVGVPALLWALQRAGDMRTAAGMRRTLSYLTALAAGALVVSGWWFARNTQLYGDPLGWDEVRAANTWMLRAMPLDWVDMLAAAPTIVISFWHAAGGIALPTWTSLPFLIWTLTPLLWLTALATIQFWRRGARILDSLRTPFGALLCWCAAMLGLYLPWLREYMSTENSRFVLGSVTVLAPMIVLGWSNIASRLRLNAALRAWSSATVATAALAATWLYPSIAIAPWFEAPAYLHEASSRHWPLAQPLAEGVTLREARAQAAGGELRVRVIWGATQPITRSYRVTISAVDDAGTVIAQQIAIPHDGRFATTQWAPGRLFADEFALPLPPGAAAAQAHVQLFVRGPVPAGAPLTLPVTP